MNKEENLRLIDTYPHVGRHDTKRKSGDCEGILYLGSELWEEDSGVVGMRAGRRLIQCSGKGWLRALLTYKHVLC